MSRFARRGSQAAGFLFEEFWLAKDGGQKLLTVCEIFRGASCCSRKPTSTEKEEVWNTNNFMVTSIEAVIIVSGSNRIQLLKILAFLNPKTRLILAPRNLKWLVTSLKRRLICSTFKVTVERFLFSQASCSCSLRKGGIQFASKVKIKINFSQIIRTNSA